MTRSGQEALMTSAKQLAGDSSGYSRMFRQPGRMYQPHAPARTWNTNISTTVVKTTLHYEHY